MKKLSLILISLILFSSCNPKYQVPNLETTKLLNMTNKQIINSFFEQVTKGNIEDAFKLIDNNANWWVPGTLPFSGNKTKEEYLQIMSLIKSGFPTGFKLMVTSMIAEDNKVAAKVISEGTHVNGKEYNNKYHFLFEIEQSKITNVKEYMDTLHLFHLIQP